MQHMFEDTTGVIKSRTRRRTDNTMAKRKKNKKRTNNNLENAMQKTKD